MKLDVVMPKMGESVTEGIVVKWWKQIGEQVQKDETLLEVSTDKVDTEVPSPVSGKIVELLFQENDTVQIGTTIAYVESDAAGTSTVSQVPQVTAPTPVSTPVTPPSTPVVSSHVVSPVDSADSKFYSPLVKSIAKAEGISLAELEKVSGTGRGGRVTKNDMLKYVQNRSSLSAQKPAATVPFSADTSQNIAYSQQEVKEVMMTPVRRKIAQHMRQSLDTSAHVYCVSECDVTHIMNHIKKNGSKFRQEEGFKLTFTPFILSATAKAIKEYPVLNSSIEGEKILYKKNINLGMAVATDNGLFVPVIRNAEEKNLYGLARGAYDLAIRARNRQLSLDDLQGSTFSISNFGVFGNVMGFPIINQPNVAILGVGTIKKRPVVIESEEGDSIAIRSMMYLSISFDHRIVDGDIGGKFLQSVVSHLENYPLD